MMQIMSWSCRISFNDIGLLTARPHFVSLHGLDFTSKPDECLVYVYTGWVYKVYCLSKSYLYCCIV